MLLAPLTSLPHLPPPQQLRSQIHPSPKDSSAPLSAACKTLGPPKAVTSAAATSASRPFTVYTGGISVQNCCRDTEHHISRIGSSCTNVKTLSTDRVSGWKSFIVDVPNSVKDSVCDPRKCLSGHFLHQRANPPDTSTGLSGHFVHPGANLPDTSLDLLATENLGPEVAVNACLEAAESRENTAIERAGSSTTSAASSTRGTENLPPVDIRVRGPPQATGAVTHRKAPSHSSLGTPPTGEPTNNPVSGTNSKEVHVF